MIPQTSVRAPTVPLFAGLLAGLVLAQQFTVSAGLLLTLSLGGTLITLLIARKKTFQPLWAWMFTISATLCFWTYGNVRLAKEPTVTDLEMPPREARLTLKISTVMQSNERYGISNVIARIQNPPKIGRLRNNDLIYARLKLPKQKRQTRELKTILQKGLLLNAIGVLTPIQHSQKTKTQSNFETYLKSIGVHYQFDRISEPQIIGKPSAFVQFCVIMNHRIQQILCLGTPENLELANIYITMLLGDSATLTKEQRERYRMTGTLHFFAISGLHIGVIAAFIAQCLLLVRIPRTLSPWIGLPLLYLYVEITGASPSAMRAFLMAAFFWSSFAVRRQPASFSALINSAILVLLFDPDQLWNLGFQLSYTVVAGILLFGLPVSRLLKKSYQIYQWLPEEDLTTLQRIVRWSLNKILALFAISVSAWLASMPLCAAYFNFIAPGAIILNLLLVHLVAIVIICGVLSVSCATLLLPSVSEFINHAAWLVIYLMDEIVCMGTTVPNINFQNNLSLRAFSYTVLGAYLLSLLWINRCPEKIRMRHFCLPVILMLGGMGLILLISYLY